MVRQDLATIRDPTHLTAQSTVLGLLLQRSPTVMVLTSGLPIARRISGIVRGDIAVSYDLVFGDRAIQPCRTRS